MKTVRFSDVVERSGRPEIHLSWVEPAKDAPLQAALKAQRIMTLHQALRGSKKDFGVIGFEPGHDAQYIVFPKSLRAFAGKRVVGIRYETFEQDSPQDSGKKAREKTADKKTLQKNSAAKEQSSKKSGTASDAFQWKTAAPAKHHAEPIDPFGRAPEKPVEAKPEGNAADGFEVPQKTAPKGKAPQAAETATAPKKSREKKHEAAKSTDVTTAADHTTSPTEPATKSATNESDAEPVTPIGRELRACLTDLDAGRLRKLKTRLTDLLKTIEAE